MNYSFITDIAFLNSYARSYEAYQKLWAGNFFSDPGQWDQLQLNSEISGLRDPIRSRMKYAMSTLSLGVYNVLELGAGRNIRPGEELYLFSGFTEIETINKIGQLIMSQDYSINPALFPNSVNHISLCYYTILKKISNYTVAITDALMTSLSFIHFIRDRVQIPEDFIVVTGEEDSDFFTYEQDKPLDIVPSFAAYKIVPGSQTGFRFLQKTTDYKQLLDLAQQSDAVFADRETFFQLKKDRPSHLYCEHALVRDNPCGIILRLALPFYFNLKGLSLIIEKINQSFYVFEVKL